jgi:cardiolipin synthase A/B
MRIAASINASYPRRGGNRIRPLIDGVPAFRAILGAVESASSSVWLTVAFLDDDLLFPDAHGSFFDVLERAAARGLDVRVLFWSEPEIAKMLADASHFPAAAASFRLLTEHAPHVKARWDRLRGYCHHQKTWLVDAGTDGEVVFVGGINLDKDSIVSPGHPHGETECTNNNHDVYAELAGPSATDVHHNFVQRWNEASERALPFGSFPSTGYADDLPFPSRASREAGTSFVQIGRTVKEGVYRKGHAAPGGADFAIAGGEMSIFEQYAAAIGAAERSIYMENQMLLCPMFIPLLDAALERGVEVVVVVPGCAMPEIAKARTLPKAVPVFAMLDALGRHPNFLMAALGGCNDDGSGRDIYVHAKIAVVDDEWATIGSANAMFRSFREDTEMNATTWDGGVARQLRHDLMAEHLGEPEANGKLDDDRGAIAILRERGLDNRELRREGRPMRGQIFAIRPEEWAVLRD